MKEIVPENEWFGFTEDKVFGWLMQNLDFCKFVLQTILPQIDIAEIQFIEPQKELNDPDPNTKDVRLDILVKDTNDVLYDMEMQVADKHNLGKRMRYYLSKLDAHYALDKGKTYNDLKEAFVIFLCDFDYPGKNRLKYVFHEYEDADRSIMLPTNAHKIIINSKGKLEGYSKDLQDLVKLMKGEKIVGGNKMFDYAQNEIAKINHDPKRRAIIVEYETKLREREQYGQRIGEEIGEEKGKKKGEHDASLRDLKHYVKDLREFGASEDEILEHALEAYGNSLSPEEIRSIVRK